MATCTVPGCTRAQHHRTPDTCFPHASLAAKQDASSTGNNWHPDAGGGVAIHGGGKHAPSIMNCSTCRAPLSGDHAPGCDVALTTCTKCHHVVVRLNAVPRGPLVGCPNCHRPQIVPRSFRCAL
jgi:hypothetical protein